MSVLDTAFARGSNSAASAPVANVAGNTERVPAVWWLNFGYTIEVEKPDGSGSETKFVSLPAGIPLDTMKLLAIKNNSQANFTAARNDLYEQIMAVCHKMAPGEERIILNDEKTGLQAQLRRVNGEADVPEANANPFVRKLGF